METALVLSCTKDQTLLRQIQPTSFYLLIVVKCKYDLKPMQAKMLEDFLLHFRPIVLL